VISPPTKRIWISAADDASLEIIMLGSMGEIAWVFASILKSAEHWPGFIKVDPIAVGTTVLGMRCYLSRDATHDDPVAEGLLWLSSDDDRIRMKRIEWSAVDSPRVGRIGTW